MDGDEADVLVGESNHSYVPEEVPTVPSREEKRASFTGSMASTDTYNSSASSGSIQIQVKPRDTEERVDDDRASHHSEYNTDLGVSLPSHQFRSIRGLPSDNAFKQGMHRSLKQRKGISQTDVRTDGAFSVNNEVIVSGEDQVFAGVDLTPEEFSQLMHRRKSIKEVPTSMRRKRSLRDNVAVVAERKKVKRISTWMSFKLRFAMGWQHFIDGCKELLYSIDIWREHLKKIQGMFGSGVLSYFILLRWLFLLNLVIVILTIFLLFIPQLVYYPSYRHNNNATFTGLELLTGDGYFTNTELYYGWYTNHTIGMGGHLVYKMPLAYLCVGGGYLLLCLAILVYSMAESYRENYIYAGDEFSFYTSKVFCSWDYGITDKEAAKLKEKSIYIDLKEVIAEQLFDRERSTKELCCLIIVRFVTNLLVLGMIAGGSYLIYYCTSLSIDNTDKVYNKLLLPVVVSVLNLLLPITFRIIASLEQYRHPRSAIQVNLARTALLKVTTLGVILVSLFFDISRCRQNKKIAGQRECSEGTKQCWETYVGIIFYRLVIVDFIFLLLSSFFGEFLRRIIAVHIGWCKLKVGLPGFDISRNVLDLVYTQSLGWIGTFFSPLLSVVNVVKLFIVFYVKRISVTQNCRASMRPFRAAKMNLLFLVLLAIAFVISLITIGYTVMSETENMMKPSSTCGPFRGHPNMYAVIKREIKGFPIWVRQAVSYVSSASFLAMLFCVLGIIVYYYKMLKDSNEKKIKLLKEQIALAGQDKLYLMKKITTGVGFTATMD